jgi:hypothetical protein
MNSAQNIKFAHAQPAKAVHNDKIIKVKLHRINASILFNKICKTEHLMPKYIHVTVNGNDHKSINTKQGVLIR